MLKKDMSTIQIRIDNKTKAAAKKVLDKLGLDMTSAIRLYLKQISQHKAIPFPLVTQNGLTLEQEAEILQASREARAGINVSKEMTAAEFLDHLKNV